MNTGFEKFLRFGEGRRMKRLAEQAAYIATLEPQFHVLSDGQLRAKTVEFRERLDRGVKDRLIIQESIKLQWLVAGADHRAGHLESHAPSSADRRQTNVVQKGSGTHFHCYFGPQRVVTARGGHFDN